MKGYITIENWMFYLERSVWEKQNDDNNNN